MSSPSGIEIIIAETAIVKKFNRLVVVAFYLSGVPVTAENLSLSRSYRKEEYLALFRRGGRKHLAKSTNRMAPEIIKAYAPKKL